MLPEGERVAVIETKLDELKASVEDLREEDLRTRTRLHNLEGFAQTYLDAQKANRRQEDRQYRRMANSIGIAGIALSLGMLLLTAVTFWAHTR